MSVAKVTKTIASSSKPFEDAVQKDVKRANETLKNVRGAWVEGQKVSCNSAGEMKEYRDTTKATFVLDD